MGKINVIFLDIDGVMNSHIFYHDRYKKRWLRLKTYKWFLVAKFNYIINGFKHKSISLADYKINPKYYEFSHTFKRLQEETVGLKWGWLSDFCNENDYKICISSVWKNHFKETSEWGRALVKLGFNEDIFVGITGERRTLRGTEIQEWVDSHDVEKYAILDDDSDMTQEQLSTCYFQVDPYFGLTPNHLYRIGNYFKQGRDE